jgi:NTE family protein
VGIEPDVVCGSSVGAFVGGAYAAGELDRLEAWVRDITRRDIVTLLDVTLNRGGLIEGRRVMAFLKDLCANAAIESLEKPFGAVATDWNTGEEVWLRQGALVDAVRASVALPGMLSPIKLNDKWLLDGGLVNPVPVSLCRALGAEVVIAVNLNSDLVNKRSAREVGGVGKAKAQLKFLDEKMSDLPAALRTSTRAIAERLLRSEPEHPGYFEILSGSINIMQDRITRSRMAEDPPEIMLSPQLAQIGLLELHRAGEAIEEGRRSVELMLPQLDSLMAHPRET